MIWFILGAAFASQMQLSLDQLYADAERVVVVEATSHEVRFVPGERGDIETQWWFAVSDTLSGPASDDLSLTLGGGKIGITGTWVEDVPEFQEDHRYLLFLHGTPEGSWVILGGEQGALPVASPNKPDAPTVDAWKARLEGGER